MAELDRTMVSIRFSGQNLNPKEFGEMLCFIESDTTESIVKRTKSGIVHWSISLKNNETFPLEEKIEALLARFTNDINVWMRATESVEADICCGLFLDGWNRGFIFTSNLMKEISTRNLDIGFDIYSPTDSWDK
jgi:hypothetical protein